jgi:hypothetical protein
MPGANLFHSFQDLFEYSHVFRSGGSLMAVMFALIHCVDEDKCTGNRTCRRFFAIVTIEIRRGVYLIANSVMSYIGIDPFTTITRINKTRSVMD